MRSFFYFISPQRYLICDPEYCAESDRSFDIKLFDLASSEKLLDLLRLFYIGNGGIGINHTYESRAAWFCGYLAAFTRGEHQESSPRRQKMATNPTVRILIQDNELFESIKKIIKKA
jgi:hypothetical protein